jgi:cellulose synthase/poly-beta-1,6-N-acetylglucosamine synthase-like glycosyltransferase
MEHEAGSMLAHRESLLPICTGTVGEARRATAQHAEACDEDVPDFAAIVRSDAHIGVVPGIAANTSSYEAHEDAMPRTHAAPYRLEPVATRRQRAVFVAMQIVFLVTLLWLSATTLTIFLSQFFTSTTVGVVIIVYCTFAVFWQLTYIYRILAMKRAVLIDETPPRGLRIAMATTIVPSREFELLLGKLEGMVHVDACGNTIDHWVLDEEDDPRVRSMIRELNRRYRHRGVRIFHFTRKGIARYNEAPSGHRFKRFQSRQKGGNINAWLDATRDEGYDLITFLDLDHVPKAGFYRKVLPYFRDQDVAFVQGPESFRNRDQNFVTRAASLERDTFFGLIHRSYFGLGMPVIVGSHTTFRAGTFHDLGGYYPVHLTEDYLIMLRLRALGKRGVFVDEVLAVGELPSTWAAYIGQQQRWASGGLDLLLRYFPAMWRRYTGKEQLFTFVLLNYYAWGAFFMFSKAVLFALLLCGLTLRLEVTLIAGIVVFTVVAMVANHLWERQFFIEPEQRSFLIENAVMNNFLGGLYFLSLLKAVVAPNTPFAVTAKSGAQACGAAPMLSYPLAAAILLALEIIALATVLTWAFASSASRGTSGYDILAFPLVLSAVANLSLLAVFRRHERSSKAVLQPNLGILNAEAAVAAGNLTNMGSQWRIS